MITLNNGKCIICQWDKMQANIGEFVSVVTFDGQSYRLFLCPKCVGDHLNDYISKKEATNE